MKVILTGFGPFGHVKDNPSHTVAAGAASGLLSRGVDCEFKSLATSIASVQAFYSSLPVGSNVFVLHIGVNAKGSSMEIEKVGRNIGTFDAAAAGGSELVNERISEDFALDFAMENPLDVDSLAASLEGKFGVSRDAGTYVCNYAYFYGLTHIGQSIRGCLFVHIPYFTVIACDEQIARVVSLVEAIARLPQFEQK